MSLAETQRAMKALYEHEEEVELKAQQPAPRLSSLQSLPANQHPYLPKDASEDVNFESTIPIPCTNEMPLSEFDVNNRQINFFSNS